MTMPTTLVDDTDLLVTRAGDVINVVLRYPPWRKEDRNGKRACHLVVDQESIRASDGIRISYDYGRDGYVIEQSTGIYDKDDKSLWIESAFIKAWARNEEDDEDY